MNSISNDISRLEKLNALFEESNKAAKIGVWEVDLINDTVFWSSTTKKYMEYRMIIPRILKRRLIL